MELVCNSSTIFRPLRKYNITLAILQPILKIFVFFVISAYYSPSKRARVFVGNIAPQVRSAELKEKFEEFGTIRQCDLKG